MTELDWSVPAADPTAIVTPKKCRRHEWQTVATFMDRPSTFCARCGAVRDEQKARRGKSARRLGHDGERRSERKYGWRKVGEYGGITDLEGTLAIVQQKTSRRLPPPLWRGVFSALAARAGGRIPLLLLSYVRQGVPSDDYIVIRAADWLALHGRDEPDRWLHVGDPAFPYSEVMSPDDPQRRTLLSDETLRAALNKAAEDAAFEQEMAHNPTEKAFHEGRVSAYHAAADMLAATPAKAEGLLPTVDKLAAAIDEHFDSCLRSHRDPDGVMELAEAIYDELAALTASESEQP